MTNSSDTFIIINVVCAFHRIYSSHVRLIKMFFWVTFFNWFICLNGMMSMSKFLTLFSLIVHFYYCIYWNTTCSLPSLKWNVCIWCIFRVGDNVEDINILANVYLVWNGGQPSFIMVSGLLKRIYFPSYLHGQLRW